MPDDRIIDLSMMRIQRGTQKVCRCLGEPLYIIDPECRKVYCQKCGAEVDSFDALYSLAQRGQRFLSSLKSLRELIAEAEGKRRRTNLFRCMENQYMAKNKMFPVCPQCNEPFRFEHIIRWIGEPWAIQRFSELECLRLQHGEREE
jgi:hypothetical protein